MKFVLHYRGILRANGNPQHKHDVRCQLHPQFETLWSQLPVTQLQRFLRLPTDENDYGLIRERAHLEFVPLVTAAMHSTVELAITALRPEPPGQLITQGGDIDNRLKTLFDALTVPHDNAVPNNATGPNGDNRIYCLLEDDNLITAVSMRTEQLLDPTADETLIDAQIHVTTNVFQRTAGNDALA